MFYTVQRAEDAMPLDFSFFGLHIHFHFHFHGRRDNDAMGRETIESVDYRVLDKARARQIPHAPSGQYVGGAASVAREPSSPASVARG